MRVQQLRDNVRRNETCASGDQNAAGEVLVATNMHTAICVSAAVFRRMFIGQRVAHHGDRQQVRDTKLPARQVTSLSPEAAVLANPDRRSGAASKFGNV